MMPLMRMMMTPMALELSLGQKCATPRVPVLDMPTLEPSSSARPRRDAAGGLVALLFLTFNLIQSKAHPHAQLRQMSTPVREALKTAFPGVPVAVAPLASERSVLGAVSSFGWSGIIAHGVFERPTKL